MFKNKNKKKEKIINKTKNKGRKEEKEEEKKKLNKRKKFKWSKNNDLGIICVKCAEQCASNRLPFIRLPIIYLMMAPEMFQV